MVGETTLIDVLSDATKIGLGAIVGGAIALISDSLKRKKESREKQKEYERKMMEEISNEFGDFYQELNSHIIELFTAIQNREIDAEFLSVANEKRKEMLKNVNIITVVYHKLLLLNDQDSANHLLEFWNIALEIIFENKEYTSDNLELSKISDAYSRCKEKRLELFEKLSGRFRN